MTISPNAPDALPRWSTADLHADFSARSFLDAMEGIGADVDRLIARFDELDIRSVAPRTVTHVDGDSADAVIAEYNRVAADHSVLGAFVYAAVATDSRNAEAQALLSELEPIEAKLRPLLARLADWPGSFDLDELTAASTEAADHAGPLRQLTPHIQSLRSHRRPRPGDGRAQGKSGQGKSHFRGLQRISDPDRGWPVAGCLDAQCRSAICFQRSET